MNKKLLLALLLLPSFVSAEDSGPVVTSPTPVFRYDSISTARKFIDNVNKKVYEGVGTPYENVYYSGFDYSDVITKWNAPYTITKINVQMCWKNVPSDVEHDIWTNGVSSFTGATASLKFGYTDTDAPLLPVNISGATFTLDSNDVGRPIPFCDGAIELTSSSTRHFIGSATVPSGKYAHTAFVTGYEVTSEQGSMRSARSPYESIAIVANGQNVSSSAPQWQKSVGYCYTGGGITDACSNVVSSKLISGGPFFTSFDPSDNTDWYQVFQLLGQNANYSIEDYIASGAGTTTIATSSPPGSSWGSIGTVSTYFPSMEPVTSTGLDAIGEWIGNVAKMVGSWILGTFRLLADTIVSLIRFLLIPSGSVVFSDLHFEKVIPFAWVSYIATIQPEALADKYQLKIINQDGDIQNLNVSWSAIGSDSDITDMLKTFSTTLLILGMVYGMLRLIRLS